MSYYVCWTTTSYLLFPRKNQNTKKKTFLSRFGDSSELDSNKMRAAKKKYTTKKFDLSKYKLMHIYRAHYNPFIIFTIVHLGSSLVFWRSFLWTFWLPEPHNNDSNDASSNVNCSPNFGLSDCFVHRSNCSQKVSR